MKNTMHLIQDAPLKAADKDNLGELNLIHSIGQGDRKAFESLYLIYHRRLSRLLSRFFDTYGIVEEIINDTMMVVWNKSHTFEQRSKVSTWIMGIAYRRMRKSFNRFDRIRQHEQDYIEQHIDQQVEQDSHEPSDREQRDWLSKAMKTLKPELQVVMEFAYYSGYSCEEIATITESPVGTVKTRMHAARKQLRSRLPELAEPLQSSLSSGGRHE